MTAWSERLAEFLPQLLAGMAVNFEIAGIAIVLGLGLGIPLAAMRMHGRHAGRIAASLIALMRAAPTFVVMFFLLNAIPREATMLGLALAMSGAAVVALSLVPYSASYVADGAVDAIREWRGGSHLGGLLFLPNLMRAFFVLVMSSGAGAAIGVGEGIAVILRHAERLPSLADKLILFAIGIACFGVPLQAGFFLMSLVQKRLARAAARGWETVLPRRA